MAAKHSSSSLLRFTKMHGAGNDYIYINTLQYSIADPNTLSRQLSRYHFGIGSDGLVLIGVPSDNDAADFSMRIFNADGSEAMMCGNASRCIGKYLYERGMTDKTTIRLETLSGIKILQLSVEEGHVVSVTVDMGVPRLNDATLFDEEEYVADGRKVVVAEREFRGRFVSMGNPHFVTYVSALDEIDIAKYGPLLETHKIFPDRCNIEFVQKLNDGSLRMRVWERGSGITLACGTGACATAVADILCDGHKRHRTVVMDGGTLTITWDAASGHVLMTGDATFVFDGEISI